MQLEHFSHFISLTFAKAVQTSHFSHSFMQSSLMCLVYFQTSTTSWGQTQPQCRFSLWRLALQPIRSEYSSLPWYIRLKLYLPKLSWIKCPRLWLPISRLARLRTCKQTQYNWTVNWWTINILGVNTQARREKKKKTIYRGPPMTFRCAVSLHRQLCTSPL